MSSASCTRSRPWSSRVRCLTNTLLLGLLAGLSSCGGARQPPAALATPSDFSVVRTYAWETDVVDPQAAWSPNDYRVAARSTSGFVILQGDDGNTPADVYRSTEGRVTYFPAWVNPAQLVFGPMHNVEKLDDGRVVPVVDGLTLVTLGTKPIRKQLSKLGYRPRVGQGLIYAQSEDRMITITETGETDEFGRGFYAEPQRQGTGVAWQETPVFETDWWTGRPQRSSLVIRWRPGHVDQLPGGVQPRWSPSGSLVATVLRADPQPGVSWWRAGTDVVFIASPGRPPIIIAHDARDGSPHPSQPVVAVATDDGRVALVSSDGSQRIDIGPGCNPQWSFDGSRLMVEDAPSEPVPTAAPVAAPTMIDPAQNVISAGAAAPAVGPKNHLTVYVLGIRPPHTH